MTKLTGSRTYHGSGKVVTDEETYQLIKKHSRLFDRINPKKMIIMWETASAILEGAVEIPKNKNWSFFGKNAPKG